MRAWAGRMSGRGSTEPRSAQGPKLRSVPSHSGGFAPSVRARRLPPVSLRSRTPESRIPYPEIQSVRVRSLADPPPVPGWTHPNRWPSGLRIGCPNGGRTVPVTSPLTFLDVGFVGCPRVLKAWGSVQGLAFGRHLGSRPKASSASGALFNPCRLRMVASTPPIVLRVAFNVGFVVRRFRVHGQRSEPFPP